MEDKKYKITLADGTEISDLALNGNNYISDSKLTEDLFAGNLGSITVEDSDGQKRTIKNVELSSLREEGSKTWFVLNEIPESILKERKAAADIQYIAMMCDVEL